MTPRLHPLFLLLVALAFSAQSTQAQVPIEFTLDSPGYVTIAIDSVSASGDTTRVHNLIQEARYGAGTHTVYWDGYDFGENVTFANGTNGYEYERSVVPAGDYLVRAIVHDGINEYHEFDVYSNQSSPPWKTAAGDGAWLSDHGVPFTAELIIEQDGTPRIYVGAITSEEGFRGISTTLDGEKVWGGTDFGNSVAGPISFAQDANSRQGRPIMLQVWDDDNGFRWEVPMLVGGGNYLEFFRWRLRTRNQPGSQGAKNQLFDIVRWNDTGIFSATAEGRLVFLDLTQSPGGTEYNNRTNSPSHIGEITGVDAPRGLAFENDGSTLLVVDGNDLERWSIDRSTGTGTLQETLVSNLDGPHDVEVSQNGEIYVSLYGTTHQIHVFDPNGNRVRTIGTAGGVEPGPYDETQMHRPRNFTLVEGLTGEYADYNGRIYVAEENYAPERVSVWTTNGEFIDGWYGSPKYAAGGEIMPSDKSRFFYGSGHGTMEFQLDWATGETRPSRLLMLPSYDMITQKDTDYRNPNLIGEFGRRYGPQTPVEMNGELYLHDSFSGTENSGLPLNTIWMYDRAEERLKQTTVFGLVGWGDSADWSVMNEEPIRSEWRSIDEAHRVAFNWTDSDGDERADPSEFTFSSTPDIRTRLYITQDLKVTFSDGRVFTPTFDAAGRPSYDPAQYNMPVDIRGQGTYSYYDFGDGTGSVVPTGHGYVQDAGPIVGYDEDGNMRWRYHNQWPTNNAGRFAPIPQYSGHLVRIGGLLTPKVFTPDQGDAGPVWGLNGYHGSMHVLTHDGLYLAELGADKRVAQRFAQATESRGVEMSGYTPSDEHYWPVLQKTDDGEVYLISGKEAIRISRVDGLDSVRRLPVQTITVTEEMIANLPGNQYIDDSYDNRPSGDATAVNGLMFDGSAADWEGANWLSLDDSRAWRGAVAYTSEHLYAVWETSNPQLLNYAGGTLNRMFADGGSLEISLGTSGQTISQNDRHRELDGQVWHEPIAGDLRIVITREGDPETGEIRAMLYEQVSSQDRNTTTYESPIRTLTLERVENISDHVELIHAGGTYEARIDLNGIGFTPQSGAETIFEIGVIEGTAYEATRRTYWGNKTQLHTSDIPSEAEVMPFRWGDLTWGDASTLSNNQAPSVSLGGVTDGQSETVPFTTGISVTGSDSDGSVTRVALAVNGEVMASANSASATFEWSTTTAGTYHIAGFAYDNSGARGHTVSRTVTVASSQTGAQQSISLQQGWNLVSAHVAPDNPDLAAVFTDLGTSLVLVKNEIGESYVPEYDINSIGNWNEEEGYKVFVSSSSTLTVNGSDLDPTAPIPLTSGWNLVSYWPSEPMPAEEAFADLGSDLVIVKDFAGNAYIPAEGINTLHGGSGDVQPGQGYQVFVENDATLTYPDVVATGNAMVAGTAEGTVKRSTPTPTAQRGVSSSATLIVSTPDMDDGTRILASTEAGETVGAGNVSDGRAMVRVWGDDPQTGTRDGAQANEKLTLRVADAPETETFQISGIRSVIGEAAKSGDIRYAPNALLAATLASSPLELELRQNYPNPARTTTKIEYVVPEVSQVRLEVYDLLGRRVATLVDEEKSAGAHAYDLDASRLSSGVYFYRLRAGGAIESRKMVVVQ